MNTIRTLMILCCLVPVSCAVIAGREEEHGAPLLDIRFVEALRDQNSLSGSGWSEPQAAAPPATSLQQPQSVFADSHRVYVIDRYTSIAVPSPRIFVFDRTARTAAPIALPVPPSEGALGDPLSVVVDGTRIVWAADAQRGAVYGYDAAGVLVGVIGRAGELGKPVALATDHARGKLYIADGISRQVKIVSGLASRVEVLEGPGATPFVFRSLCGLAVDRKGDLYALDCRGKAVHVYAASGEKVRVLHIPDDLPLIAPRLTGIAVDSDGHVYLTDVANNTVLIFAPDGAFLHTWGRTGNLAGDFWLPAGIFIDDHDHIYIADQMNGRVQVFQYVK